MEGTGPGSDAAERHPVSAVVLAAGASRRFGAPKLLASLAGRALIRRTVENTLAAGIEPVVVVLGREADAVRQALDGLPARFVENPRFAEGMSGSIRAGIAALPAGTRAALIVLGDQPTVGPAIFDRLVRAYHVGDRPVVVPVYAGIRGNPVLFDAALFPMLLRLEGDRGARGILETMPERIAAVHFPFAPPEDVDTPEAFEALMRRLGEA